MECTLIIDMEWCNQSRVMKYLFKYVNKGHDKVTTTLCEYQEGDNIEQNVDEIKAYYNCRCVCVCVCVKLFRESSNLIYIIKIL